MDKENLIKTARKLYLEEDKSCSESILLALKSGGFDVPDSLLDSIAGLRAGIGGTGCVCGALMAAVLVAGYLHGGSDKKKANQLSAELHNKFRDKFKSACCRVLTRKYDFQSKERKEFCAGLVEFMISELVNLSSS